MFQVESIYDVFYVCSFAEISLIVWFLILVFLWVFRDPVFIPGWESWLGLQRGYIHTHFLINYRRCSTVQYTVTLYSFNSDAVAGMLVSCILFAWPRFRLEKVHNRTSYHNLLIYIIYNMKHVLYSNDKNEVQS